jgi:hypothetical protein
MAKRLRAQFATAYGVDLTHSQSLGWSRRRAGLATGTPSSRALPQTSFLGASNATIPVLRIFSLRAAVQFYVDFLGYRLDFGGPAGGAGTPYYGQVSRAATRMHLTEVS